MDDARIMMRIAESRSVNKIEDPSLREFLQEPLARLYPEQYHRLLEIELMASISCCRSRPDFALSRWLEAQQLLEALLRACGSQEELLAAVCAEDRKDLRTCLVIWSLLDRASPHVSAAESTFDFLEAAEGAVLTRLEEEGNPRGSRRRDGTTDLYGICLAMLGNRLRVRGDVMGGFELTKQANGMIRPGGNTFIIGKISLYSTATATASGHLRLARTRVGRALTSFREIDYLTAIGESLNKLTHIDILTGNVSMAILKDFLGTYESSHRLPKQVIIQTKINLVGVMLYFHSNEDVGKILDELEKTSVTQVESLWVQYFRAMWHLKGHRPALAAAQFRYLAFEFEMLGQPIQACFAVLFEILCLLDSGESLLVRERAAAAAEFLSSSHFYGGLAAQLADQLLTALHCDHLDRRLVENVLDTLMSPAKERRGGA